MSNPKNIQSFLDGQVQMLLVVEEVLNSWSGEGCLQFPTLMSLIESKMSWDEKQLRAKEPIVREYVRTHPDWHVTRGAHGGIMKAEEKQKKEAAKAAKEKAKAELEAEIAKRAAAKAEATTTAPDVTVDDTNKDSE